MRKPRLGGGPSLVASFPRRDFEPARDQCRAEAPIGPPSDASSSGYFIPSTGAIPATAQQPAAFAAAQNVVQDLLASRLLAQGVDRLGSSARAKSAGRHRFQDREFD
jgi:hypothetical protein